MLINKLIRSLCLAVLVAPPTAAIAADAPPRMDAKTAAQTTIATVNGVAINQLSATLLRDERQSRGMPQDTSTDKAVLESLITAEIMAQQALSKGLDKNPTVQAVLDLQRKEILGKLLLEDYASTHPVAEERIKAEYDRIKAKSGDTEYLARHILVDDEKLAKEIAGKLGGKKPTKFEDLAKKYSKDSSAAKGGELGWMAPANLVPEFASAMVQLKKGEYTKAPVKTRFGWHLIKLLDSRKLEFPAYDKVKDRLSGQLVQQDIRKYLAELRATAKVDITAKK